MPNNAKMTAIQSIDRKIMNCHRYRQNIYEFTHVRQKSVWYRRKLLCESMDL